MGENFSEKADLANIIRIGVLMAPIAAFVGQLMMGDCMRFLVKMHSVVLRQHELHSEHKYD